jgi:hypothetical protein
VADLSPYLQQGVQDLATLFGLDWEQWSDDKQAQAATVLSIVTAMASSYTRTNGFTAGVPCDAIRCVVLTASARLITNPSGTLFAESEGPSSIEYRSSFTGWAAMELYVLNRFTTLAV